jgi:hypothetical protein
MYSEFGVLFSLSRVDFFDRCLLKIKHVLEQTFTLGNMSSWLTVGVGETEPESPSLVPCTTS